MYVYGQRGQEAICFRDQYSFFFSQASIQRAREGRLRAGILEIKAWIYRSKKGGAGTGRERRVGGEEYVNERMKTILSSSHLQYIRQAIAQQ
jgi:hypothetical protein